MRIRWSLNTKFLVSILFVVGLFMSIVFYWMFRLQERHILEQVNKQAKIITKQIILTRKWVAKHGGVFVEKLPWVKSNPYLIKPDISDTEGKIYTKKNPASVTRELSDFAEKEGYYKFRVTSLNLINPRNAPDEYEKQILQEFYRGNFSESSKIEKINNKKVFRYLTPLFIEEACLKCHGVQGYKIGEVKGAISVMIPMDEAEKAIWSNNIILLFSGIGIIIVVSMTLFSLVRLLVIKPVYKLKDSTYKIGKGEYESPCTINTGDELDELCSAFNSMAERLKESYALLEKRVRDATTNLEDTNIKLTQAYKELKELDRLKTEFLSNVSHELRSPLTAMRGGIEYLLRKADSKDISFLVLIKKNTDHLIRMVNDLLDLSKIESGKMELYKSKSNISQIVMECITTVQMIAEEKHIKIDTKFPSELYATVDSDRIKQVLLNLLSNSLKFTPEEGKISVMIKENKDNIEVSVEDTGVGIPEKDLSRIFEKFQQVMPVNRAKISGSGLGLTISRGIIEAHDGKIWVESKEGQGSNFIFILPKEGA